MMKLHPSRRKPWLAGFLLVALVLVGGRLSAEPISGSITINSTWSNVPPLIPPGDGSGTADLVIATWPTTSPILGLPSFSSNVLTGATVPQTLGTNIAFVLQVPTGAAYLVVAWLDGDADGIYDLGEPRSLPISASMVTATNVAGINPSVIDDTDADTLPDWWEALYFSDLDSVAAGDDDNDSLTNIEEYNRSQNTTVLRTLDPSNWDSDGDLMDDGWEIDHFANGFGLIATTNDATNDLDGEGLSNLQEYRGIDGIGLREQDPGAAAGVARLTSSSDDLNPRNVDSDADGLVDSFEAAWYDVGNGVDPAVQGLPGDDPDQDGLSNHREQALLVEFRESASLDLWTFGTNGLPTTDANGIRAFAPALLLGASGFPTIAAGLDALRTNAAWTDPTPSTSYGDSFNASGADTDGDDLPDGWEVEFNLDPRSGAIFFPAFPVINPNGQWGDPDGDNLRNIQEFNGQDGDRSPTLPNINGTGDETNPNEHNWRPLSTDAGLGVARPQFRLTDRFSADLVANDNGTLGAALPTASLGFDGGVDTDDDGVDDNTEIQNPTATGLAGTSPVHSMHPFTNRAASITGTNGIPIPEPEGSTTNGYRPDLHARDWTLETYVMIETTNVNGYLINHPPPLGLEFFITGPVYRLELVNGLPRASFTTAGNFTYTVSGVTMPTNQWVHLAAVWDHAENSLRLHMDGIYLQEQIVFEDGISALAFPASSNSTITLGEASDGSFSNTVHLDEVRIWGVPRSLDEVEASRTRLVAQDEPGLLAYYRFDDGGTYAEDFVRKAQNGLLAVTDPDYTFGDFGYGLSTNTGSWTFNNATSAPVRGVQPGGADDADGDGLPDAWEAVNHLDPNSAAGADGPDGDPDGDGLGNLYEFWSETNPQATDTDQDGVLDGNEDFDGDSVANLSEQSLNSRPDIADTDDDSFTDAQEQGLGTDLADSLDPATSRAVRLGGDPEDYLEVPLQFEQRLTDFTIEAWVNVTSAVPANSEGIILRRTVQDLGGSNAVNYVLGLSLSGGSVAPYAGYVLADSNQFIVNSAPLPGTGWVHLAATYDSLNATMTVYTNGELAASASSFFQAPPLNGKGGDTFVRIGEDFEGVIDEIRLWSAARDQSVIFANMNDVISGAEPDLVHYFRFDDGQAVDPTAAEGAEDFTTTEDWQDQWEHAARLHSNVVFSSPGRFLAPPGLRVVIKPFTAVADGAQWNVDFGPFLDSGALAAGLSPGSHVVDYKPISGWTAPAAQGVTLTNGVTTTITNTYLQNGSLTVAITPVGAVTGGARWRVDGGAYRTSGATATNLSPGTHTVEFLDIPNWAQPTNISVTILPGQNLLTSGVYTAEATLTVVLEPAAAVAAGAVWNIDALTNLASGATATNLGPGNHSVSFGAVTGWAAPTNITVALAAGENGVITNTYVPTPTVQVNIDPAAAITAGALWNLDGGANQASGTVLSNLSVGVHTAAFVNVGGWATPPDIVFAVTNGSAVVTSGTYVLNGTLAVTLTPAGAVAAGAQWNVDGGPDLASGTVVTNLAVGVHTAAFTAVSGWTASTNSLTVVIANGSNTTATVPYTSWGNLSVTIAPAAAIAAGAQWNVNGNGANLASGAILTQLSNDVYSVAFTDLPGWGTPTNLSLVVVDGLTTAATGTYTAIDTDNDGLNDTWETNFFGHLGFGPGDDPDNDNLSNLTEHNLTNVYALMNPFHWDSDGDGMDDEFEFDRIANGFGLNPGSNDAFGDVDGDGLANVQEYNGINGIAPVRGTAAATNIAELVFVNVGGIFFLDNDGLNPLNVDTDGDQLFDSYECAWYDVPNGINPLSHTQLGFPDNCTTPMCLPQPLLSDLDNDGMTIYREQALQPQLRQGTSNDLWSSGPIPPDLNFAPRQADANGIIALNPKLDLGATNDPTIFSDVTLAAIRNSYWTNPWEIDSDADTLPDAWEVDFNLDPSDRTGANGRFGDPDGDGLANIEEYRGQDGEREEIDGHLNGTGDETNPNEYNWRPNSTAAGDGASRPAIDDLYWETNGLPIYGTLGGGLPTTDSLGSDLGADTDDDGIPDHDEIRAAFTNDGASSPVHSMHPFIQRAALITSTNGIIVRDPEQYPGGGFRPLFHSRSWTLEAHVYMTATNTTGDILDCPGPETNGASAFRLSLSNNVPRVSFHTLGSILYYVDGPFLRPGRWAHIAGVWDPEDNSLSLYVDGIFVQEQIIVEESLSVQLFASSSPPTIGRAPDGSFVNSVFIDEVRVWSVPRTREEIDLYRSRLVPQHSPGLTAYYRFDDGGTTAEDFARKAVSGSIRGTTNRYLFGDHGYALTTSNFTVVATNVAPIRGIDDVGADDFDFDGIPDAWELVNHLDPRSAAGLDGADGDPDGDGLLNAYEYWAETNPHADDTDQDGVLDGNEDFDGDGLANQIEQNIGSRPDLIDTDDDGLSDSAEQVLESGPASSSDPSRSQAVRLAGSTNDYLTVPITLAQRLVDFTLEAWVWPEDTTNGAGSVIRRVVQNLPGGANAVNFMLGIETNGAGLQPFAGYILADGTEFVLRGGALTTTNWTHLAASYDSATANLIIYTNGAVAVSTNTFIQAPPLNGRGGETFVRIGEDYEGLIDELRVWNTPRTALQINNSMVSTLAGSELGLVHYFPFDDGQATTNDFPFGEFHQPNGAEDFTHPNDWTNLWEHAARPNTPASVTFVEPGVLIPPPTLRVIITPQEAIDAGAQWSVNNLPFMDSGTTLINLEPGNYVVTFKSLPPNWTKPDNISVTLFNGQSTNITAAYRLNGSVSITLEPAAAVSAGAGWRLDKAGAFLPSGETLNGVSPAPHVHDLEFAPVDGWTAPPALTNLTVAEGQDLAQVYTYNIATGSLTVILAPTNAILDGATWWIDNGAERASGDSVNLAAGIYTINYKDVFGWIAPFSGQGNAESIAINNNNIITNTRTYIAVATSDLDGDGLEDPWENLWFGNIEANPSDDSDNDGLTNLEEHDIFQSSTNFALLSPADWDSDNDLMDDGWEWEHYANGAGLNPVVANGAGDIDGDGLLNLQEYNGVDGIPDLEQDPAFTSSVARATGSSDGLNPLNVDTDSDSLVDSFEAAWFNAAAAIDPSSPGDAALDADDDGLANYREQALLLEFREAGSNDLWSTGSNALPSIDGNGIRAFVPALALGATSNTIGSDLVALRGHEWTSPADVDTDDDLLPDGWETEYNLDPTDSAGANGTFGNPDSDGLLNIEEYRGADGDRAASLPAINGTGDETNPNEHNHRPNSTGPGPGTQRPVIDILYWNTTDVHTAFGTLGGALPTTTPGTSDNGADTDDDGIPDDAEIRQEFTNNIPGTSPVHSMHPFVKRSALITSTNGITIPDPEVYPGGGFRPLLHARSWTIELLVNLAGTNHTGYLIDNPGPADLPGSITYRLALSNNVPRVSFHTVGSLLYYVDGPALPTNRWVHLAGVWDPFDNSLSLYVDGIFVQEQRIFEEALSGSFFASATPPTIGAAADGSFTNRVMVDEVRIWSVARDPAEVETYRTRLAPPGSSGLIAYYRFDDGGTSAEDFTRRAQSGLLGATTSDHVFGDFGYALGGGFSFVTSNVAQVRGVDINGADDGDGDGLPDGWEAANHLDPNSGAGSDGGDGDPDGDGLNNLYEYWSKTNPHAEDTDQDGVLDSNEDFDGDTVANLIEQTIGSRPDLIDTDDNGQPDNIEQGGSTDPANSVDPPTSRAARLGGGTGDYLVVPQAFEQRLTDFTLEAWVNPTSAVAGVGTIIERAVQDLPGGSNAINYSLSLATNAGGMLVPVAGYVLADGSDFTLTGTPLTPAEWTHLAVTYDSAAATLTIYTNGAIVATTNDFTAAPPLNGKGGETYVRIGQDVEGLIDDVRVWSVPRTQLELLANFDAILDGDEPSLVHYFRFDDSEAATNVFAYGPLHQPNGAEDFTVDNDWTNEWAHAARINPGGDVTFYAPGAVDLPATLRIILLPAQVLLGGAQWSIDGGPFNDSGATIGNLEPGNHTIIYRSVDGWTAPASESLSLSNSTATTLTRVYRQNGSIQITLEPAEVVAEGAGWRLDGSGPFNFSEVVVPDLAPTSHVVDYLFIDGWTAPTSEVVVIPENDLLPLTRQYTRKNGSVTAIIQPAGAISNGAQWRVNGGAPQDSGTTNTLPTGTYEVEFIVIPNWTPPAPQEITIGENLVTEVTGVYTPGQSAVSGTAQIQSTWDNLPPDSNPPGDDSGAGDVIVGVWGIGGIQAIGTPVYSHLIASTTNLPFALNATYSYVIGPLPPISIFDSYKLLAWIDADGNGSFDVGEPNSSVTFFTIQGDNVTGVNVVITDDEDNDELPDWWERHWFGDLDENGNGDADNDGLSNSEEYNISRNIPALDIINPNDWDTDGDLMGDNWEFDLYFDGAGMNPVVDDAFDDADGDGLANVQEYNGVDGLPLREQDPTAAAGVARTTASTDDLNPFDVDTDDDGLVDSFEAAWYDTDNGIDPNNAGDPEADSDEDGLSNYREQALLAPLAEGGTNDIWTTGAAFVPTTFAPGLPLGATNDPTIFGDIVAIRGQAWTDPTDGSSYTEVLQPGSDTDGDDLPDGWELEFNLDPRDATGANGAAGDPDSDGLLNNQEYRGQDGDRSETLPFVNGTGDETNPNEHNWRPDSTTAGAGTERDTTLGSASPTISLGADGGNDTDDDGIPDDDEVQEPFGNGTLGTSPVHSMHPFVRRSALITNTNGIPIPDPESIRSDLHQRDWTIEISVLLNTTNATGFLIDHQGPSGSSAIAYRLELSNNVPLLSFDTDGEFRYTVTGPALPTNRWMHMAGVWNHALNSLALYIDGIFVQEQQVNEEAFSATPFVPASPPRLAAAADGSFSNVVCIDEVRIWGVARTPAEVDQFRNKLVPPSSTGLLAYYRFDDGGTTAEDFARRAQSGLLGATTTDYLFGDQGYALATNGFSIVSNKFADIRGIDDTGADDSDGDGLPDGWEVVNHLDPFSAAGDDGADGDPDGDGLINSYEYWSETNPHAQDTDQDGVLDVNEDFDGDTVVNLTEQDIGSRPDLIDTDDDGLPDNIEQGSGTDPANSVDPPIARAMAFNGDDGCYLEVPTLLAQRLTDFSIEAWVNPTDTVGGSGVILERVVQNLGGGTNAVNYVLGIATNGSGDLVPYSGYTLADGRDFRVVAAAAISTGIWTHLAAAYDSQTASLVVYTNGGIVASTNGFSLAPPLNGKGGETYVRIGQGFGGAIDEVRLWSTARSTSEIANNRTNVFAASEPDLVHFFRFDDAEATTNYFPFGAHHQPHGSEDFMFPGDWNDEWEHAAVRSDSSCVSLLEPGAILSPPSLKVTLVPAEVVASGARWFLDGDAGHNSGDTVVNLTPGTHTITFSGVGGWTTPGEITTNLTTGTVTPLTATYIENGSIQFTLFPTGAVAGGAQWQIDSGPFQNSGVAVGNLTPGDYDITFKDVDGWLTPAPRTVSVAEDQDVVQSASYNEATGTLIVAFSPGAVTNLGAGWRINGGSLRDSGEAVALPAGDYTISFEPVPGWLTPANLSATVFHNQITTNSDAEYQEGIDAVSGRIYTDSLWDNLPPVANPPGDGSGGGNMTVGVWYPESEVSGAPFYSAVITSTNALPFPSWTPVITNGYVYTVAGLEAPSLNYKLIGWIDANTNGGYDIGEPRSAIAVFHMLLSNNTEGINATIVDDFDADGLPDSWEVHWFGDLDETGGDDADRDGLTNLQEYNITENTPALAALSPVDWDSDDDGMDDKWEFDRYAAGAGLDPTTDDGAADLDGDGLLNIQEYNGIDGIPPMQADPIETNFALATGNTDELNPSDLDTDDDGLIDSFEATWYSPAEGIDPGVANAAAASGDPDGDGLTSYREQALLVPLREGGSNDIWSLGAAGFPPVDANGIRAFSPPLLLGATGTTIAAAFSALQDGANSWLDPNDWDSDDDLLPDGWETEFNLDARSGEIYFPAFPTLNPNSYYGDADGDGLNNFDEYLGQDGDRSATDPFLNGTGDETNPNEHNWRPDSTGVGPGTMRPLLDSLYWITFNVVPSSGTLGGALPTLSSGADDGYDTDDDGIPDNVEIQQQFTNGPPASSPVHSMDPFIRRAALVTDTNGILIPEPDLTLSSVGDYRPLLHARDWTVELYVKLDGANMTGNLLDYVDGNGIGYVYNLSLSNNVPRIEFDSTSYAVVYSVTGPVLPTNQWIHLAASWSHADNNLSLYVNGSFVQEQLVLEEGWSSRIFPSAYPPSIGWSPDGSFANRLCVDEVRIWGVARSPQEIEDFRRKLVPPSTTGLLAYYRFDDGGTSAEDFTRRAQNGLLGAASTDYTFGDFGYALSTNSFLWKTNDFAPVNGVDDNGADDTDGDGMPDAWEMVHHLDPNSATGDDGADGDPDGDGLLNRYEYWSRTNPEAQDSDQDAILDPNEDHDGDTIANVAEQTLNSRPDLIDTDDDGVTDTDEFASGTSPAKSTDPGISRAARFGGAADDFVRVPLALTQRLTDWTVEAWVKPTNTTDGVGTIVGRVVQNLGGGANAMNYVIGVETNGTGGLRPYAGYILADGTEFLLRGGTIPAGEYTHLAATFLTGQANNTLVLYTNSVVSASTIAFTELPPNNGRGGDTGIRIGEDFAGLIDEVRIWDSARSAADIGADFDEVITTTPASLLHYFRFDDSQAVDDTVPFGPGHQPHGAEDFVYPEDWNEQWIHAAELVNDVRFVQDGAILLPPSIRVFIEPQLARDLGAQWQVIGQPGLHDSGDIVDLNKDILAYTVIFTDLSSQGLVAPTNELVAVSNGFVTTITRTYTELGSITVQLQPQTVVDEGAVWFLDGDQHETGETVSNLPPASDYVITFSDVVGWVTPTTRTATVTSGNDTLITAVYDPVVGDFQIVLHPEEARIDGAQWRVDGGAYVDSGAIISNLSFGDHLVDYLPLPGWISPASEILAVTTNGLHQFTNTYFQETGILTTISPSNAILDGAQWNVNGGSYSNSGESVVLSPGGHTVAFKDISGWLAPTSRTVIVTNDVLTRVNVSYIPVVIHGFFGAAVGQFDGPRGMAVDSNNNLYVADTGNDRIQILDATGGTWSAIGSLGTGAGEFDNPFDVAFDSDGNLYVADTFNNRVQRRHAGTGTWTVWGGVAIGSGLGEFNKPYEVVVDSQTNLYVADRQNRRVQRRTAAGVWSEFIGNGFADGFVRYAQGLAIDDQDNLYVADDDTSFSRIQRFSPAGGTNFVVIGGSDAADGGFDWPRSMIIDPQTNVVVADTFNSRIVTNDVATGDWSTFISQTLDEPEGVARDAKGIFYIADTGNHRIIQLDLSEPPFSGPITGAYDLLTGAYSVWWQSTAGWRYAVQCKQSLTDGSSWQTVPGCENIAGTGLFINCVDIAAIGAPVRFYRVVAY